MRRIIPRKHEPLLDDPPSRVPEDERFEQIYLQNLGGSFLRTDEAYVRARYSEACRTRMILARYQPSNVGQRRAQRVLDLGGGNGAFELTLTAAGYFAVSAEPLWNETARLAHRNLGIPFRRVVADAALLPFRSNQFDAVTCIDTLEHLKQPARVAEEAFRVAGPGAALLVTTPSRLRFLFRPDPHFSIRGLVILPPSLQRWVAARRGFGELYYVDRIYDSVRQIRALFPSVGIRGIVSGTRGPRNLFWDALIFEKPIGASLHK